MIRNEALKCLALLHVCVEQLKGRPLERAQEQVSRFNLWASNIGVFARFSMSLDYRLHDAPDIAEIIIGMLRVLAVRVRHGKCLPVSGPSIG
jgi:hypothetical protein